MAKFKRVESEVEQFLPNYFLSEEEQAQVTNLGLVPMFLGIVCFGVCLVSLFYWATSFNGSGILTTEDVKNSQRTVAAMNMVSDSLAPVAQTVRLPDFTRHKK